MTPLEKARAKRVEMKAAGVRADKHVTFFGAAGEVDLIEKAARRAGYTSMTTYVKDTTLKQAEIDANKPVKPRSTKTAEQLKAEAAKLLERASKL